MSADEQDWLQAFVAFVSDETGVDNTSGEIAIDGIVENTITLVMTNSINCVTVNPNTEFYQIETIGDISNLLEISIDNLMEGDFIDVSGDLVGECIQAQTVIKES